MFKVSGLALVVGAGLFRMAVYLLFPHFTHLLSVRVELANAFVGLSYCSLAFPLWRPLSLSVVTEVAYLLKMGVRIYDYGSSLPVIKVSDTQLILLLSLYVDAASSPAV